MSLAQDRDQDPTNFITGEETTQQTSPIHGSSSTSTLSMERPIDKEYATGMDKILTLQITQQTVQVQDTPRSAPVPPKDHCDTDSSLIKQISIPFTPQISPLP